MKVILAKTAGFCFGVKRAVDTVYKELEKGEYRHIYTYGPIIHNDVVISDLEEHGVSIIRDESELYEAKDGVVIIRSHGVPRRICDKLENSGISYIDATCPFVKKIHRIASDVKDKNGYLIIIGNGKHPEVEGIRGWAGEDCSVISSKEEAELFQTSADKKLYVVAQTTYNYNKYKEIVEIISKKGYDMIVHNTICSATKERQEEALEIANRVDAMIVVGDKHSSNTQKLFEICDHACSNTYYIQTLDDLDVNQLRSVETVGITAGASTPNKLIEEVQKECQN